MLFPLPEVKTNEPSQLKLSTIVSKNKAVDPITNRLISSSCWNGFHEEEEIEASLVCIAEECKCFCHDHNPIQTGAND